MNKDNYISLDNTRKLALITKALSSEMRIEMLKLLCANKMNVNEMAERLSLPASTAAMHVKVLEDAGLIKTILKPGVRGTMKVCEKVADNIVIKLGTAEHVSENVELINMPIGNYVDYKVTPTCGIVSEKGEIDEEDMPRCFYNPNRINAKLIWFGDGYLEYRFPNNILQQIDAKEVEISAELCSEDHEYNLDWPTEITMWINGIEAGTFYCESDYGGRRGKLNPEWWPDKNTQYGILKKWKLKKNGTYLDDEKTSDKTVDEYYLKENDYISVRIGVKEDAVNRGGVNIFGDCFGDHEQNILMKIVY